MEHFFCTFVNEDIFFTFALHMDYQNRGTSFFFNCQVDQNIF